MGKDAAIGAVLGVAGEGVGVVLQGAVEPLLTNATRAFTNTFTDAAASGLDDAAKVTWRSTWDDVVAGVSGTWNTKVPLKPRVTNDAPTTTMSGSGAVVRSTKEPTSAASPEPAPAPGVLFRGVNDQHHAYQEALLGQAWPGDVLGHSDAFLHAAGLTYESSLTSWTSSRAVAEEFARGETGRGVILRIQLPLDSPRIVPGPDALGEQETLLRGVVFDAETEGIGW